MVLRASDAIVRMFLLLGVVFAACRAPPPAAPQPLRITPPDAPYGEGPPIVVNGRFGLDVSLSFDRASSSGVDSQFSAWLGGTELLDVIYIDRDTLQAVVPADVPVGRYTLVVADPRRRRGTLSDAFTVTRAGAGDGGPTAQDGGDAAVASMEDGGGDGGGDASGGDASGGDAGDGQRGSGDRTPPVCARVVVNEVVSWSQHDWDDSAGGDGVPFNALFGNGAFDNSTDEWVELANLGCTISLVGYTIAFDDNQPNSYTFGVTAGSQVLVFSAGGSIDAFASGEYLVIGNPGDGGGSQQITSSIHIRLRDPAGLLMDDVATGSTGMSPAPSGTSTSAADEALARVPDGTDTGVHSVDWVKTAATPGGPNL